MARGMVLLLWALASGVRADTADDTAFLEDFLDRNLSVGYTYTAVFDTHPPGVVDNTGNVFKFIPHGHLTIRHSTLSLRLGPANPDYENTGETTLSLTTRLSISGLVAEAERGEVRNIIDKVVHRNYLEPALRKVFRRKLGAAFVDLLDRTVVEEAAERLSAEILARIPVTASLRQVMVELGHVMAPGRYFRVRVGLLQPSYGPLRDGAGRTRLDERILAAAEVQHRMSYPSRTLALEFTHFVPLSGRFVIQTTVGIHQAQDPDATIGQTFRNAVFDEGSTVLSLEKIDDPFVRVALTGDAFEAYVSAAENEGLALAAGIHYGLTRQIELALHVAGHDPDPGDLTRFEAAAETAYRRGVAAALLFAFTPRTTGYLLGESLEGVVGRRQDLRRDSIEAGVVRQFASSARWGLAVYARERNDDTDTGVKLSFGINF